MDKESQEITADSNEATTAAQSPGAARKGGLSRSMLKLAKSRWKKARTALGGFLKAAALAKDDRNIFQAESKQALAMAQQGLTDVKLEVADVQELSKINYMQQGDAELCTEQALVQRHALRTDQDVMASVREWWNFLPKGLPHTDAAPEPLPSGGAILSKQVYSAMVVLIQMVLLPRFGMQPDPEYDPEEDWLDDNKGQPVMGFPDYFDAMFELADMWCSCVSAQSYRDLLDGLLADAKASGLLDGLLKRFGWTQPLAAAETAGLGGKRAEQGLPGPRTPAPPSPQPSPPAMPNAVHTQPGSPTQGHQPNHVPRATPPASAPDQSRPSTAGSSVPTPPVKALDHDATVSNLKSAPSPTPKPTAQSARRRPAALRAPDGTASPNAGSPSAGVQPPQRQGGGGHAPPLSPPQPLPMTHVHQPPLPAPHHPLVLHISGGASGTPSPTGAPHARSVFRPESGRGGSQFCGFGVGTVEFDAPQGGRSVHTWHDDYMKALVKRRYGAKSKEAQAALAALAAGSKAAVGGADRTVDPAARSSARAGVHSPRGWTPRGLHPRRSVESVPEAFALGQLGRRGSMDQVPRHWDAPGEAGDGGASSPSSPESTSPARDSVRDGAKHLPVTLSAPTTPSAAKGGQLVFQAPHLQQQGYYAGPLGVLQLGRGQDGTQQQQQQQQQEREQRWREMLAQGHDYKDLPHSKYPESTCHHSRPSSTRVTAPFRVSSPRPLKQMSPGALQRKSPAALHNPLHPPAPHHHGSPPSPQMLLQRLQHHQQLQHQQQLQQDHLPPMVLSTKHASALQQRQAAQAQQQ